MIKSSRVSIIITFVDEYDFLTEAIQSAFRQELDDSEIIVVCNAKTGYRDFPEYKDAGVIFIHEPIPGSAFARNAGLEQASGAWIQFLDVDDILLRGKIKDQLMQSSGDAIVSPHLYKRISGDTVPSKSISDDIWKGLLNSGLGSTSSMLFKKESIVNIGGWSTQYQSHQEYELLFRLAMTGFSIVFVNNLHTIVRERKHGSLTQNTKPVRVKEGIQLRESMWQFLRDQSLDTPERKIAFLEYIFRQLRGLFKTDKAAAKKIYNDYFYYTKFSPAYTGIPFYNIMYHWLGFNRTELILKSYTEFRDRLLPFLPKNH